MLPTSSTHEINHFDYFRTIVTQQFSSYVSKNLWNRTIVQVAHTEPSIWSAAIALASAHRLQLEHTLPWNPQELKECDLHYLSALSSLNKRLDRSPISWEVALIGSLLFAVFEVLRGNDLLGLKHMQSGLSILREYLLKFPVQASNSLQLCSLSNK